MTCSLVITTYNRPDALLLCLESVLVQSHMPDEIIIADDGSTRETSEMLQTFRDRCPVPLIHVWQQDRGFRVARSRNNGLAVSHGTYIIGVDGDLVLHRHFVADHLALARQGFYLKGGRCKLTQQRTQQLCEAEEVPRFSLFARGVSRKRENMLHIPTLARWLAPRYRRNKAGVLGCNESFFRADCVAINGYDESYDGWGGEDYDFIMCLKRSGIKKRHLKFAGLTLHLWHNERGSAADIHRGQEQEAPMVCRRGMDRAIAQLENMKCDDDTIIFPG